MDVGKQRYRQIFERLRCGLAIWDESDSIREWNPSFASLLGESDASIEGSCLQDWVFSENYPALCARLKGGHEQEVCLFSRSTKLAIRASHLAGKEWVLEAREAASLSAVDEVLAVLAHELRTPLGAVQGWVEMLIEAFSVRLDPQILKKGLLSIRHNTQLQAKLVSDLFDASRMSLGKIALTSHRVEFKSLAMEVIHGFELMAEQMGVRLIFECECESAFVLGESERLSQVIGNLIANALKFTPSGGEVRVCIASLDAHVLLEIRDTGYGIEPEFLPRIFERFAQGRGARRGGLGLGLAIVREIVELHGGQIAAQSEGSGQGALFRVLIPRES